MEKFELDKTLAEEIRARVLGDGFMKLVQSVRRNGKTFRISLRPVLIAGETRYQAEMNDEGQVRVKNLDANEPPRTDFFAAAFPALRPSSAA